MLRDYPYQVIAYLEDLQPSLMPLHCTLKRRFKPKSGAEILDITNALRLLFSNTQLEQLQLGELTDWSSTDKQYHYIHVAKDIAALKRQLDEVLDPLIEVRDQHLEGLENLHISFDTARKHEAKKPVGQSYDIVRFGLQIDYSDRDSTYINLSAE